MASNKKTKKKNITNAKLNENNTPKKMSEREKRQKRNSRIAIIALIAMVLTTVLGAVVSYLN